MAGCKAREDAVVAVIKAATKNNSLHFLDLRGVPLGPDVRNHLVVLIPVLSCRNAALAPFLPTGSEPPMPDAALLGNAQHTPCRCCLTRLC